MGKVRSGTSLGTIPRMRDRRRIKVWVWLCAAISVALFAAVDIAAVPRRAAMEDRMNAVLDGEGMFVDAYPLSGEGLYAFTRRLCGDDRHWRTVSASNRNTRNLRFGQRYRVPMEVLRPELRFRVLRALFPEDQLAHDGWRHQVRSGYSTRALSRWFTGAESTATLKTGANLTSEPQPGQEIFIPKRLLRPDLQTRLPEAPRYDLAYGEDEQGKYATYRLQGGEALYSAVVVRFTGRVYAEEVNALAAEIAQRSDIPDVTDIPIGYQVKIPYEMLQPEFLPADDPKRQEWEAGRRASAQYRNLERTTSLSGVTVILDAGHGGKDVGTSQAGVWESVYVYDIMVRLKGLLEEKTAASVHATTRDGAAFRVQDRDVIPYSRGHQVLTTPAYAIQESTVSAHLRWYLSNSRYRHAVRSGSSSKVVFLSIHADSLHPSLRGAMAYIPAASLRGGTYSRSGSVYSQRREVREAPRVTLSRRDVIRSEGLSRQLAESLIGSLRRRGVAIHKDKPIRDRIIRRRAFVPAVLRYNLVPAGALVEVCNLANPRDRALIQTVNFRQTVAESLFAGIMAYYGEQVPVSDLAAFDAGGESFAVSEATNSSGHLGTGSIEAASKLPG